MIQSTSSAALTSLKWFLALSVMVPNWTNAQIPVFVAGPTAEIIEPTIPPTTGGPQNANLSLVASTLAADLRGNGRADVVVGVGLNPFIPPTKLPMRVLRSGAGGVLTDVTRQLFGNGALPSAAGPRALYTADFNSDGRPDLFCACQGYDGSPPDGETNILLQQAANGTFIDRSSILPSAPDYTHSAAIGDVDGDGIVDVYVGNVSNTTSIGPYFLVGKSDGTFPQKNSTIPASIASLSQKYTTSVLVDVDNDGFPDLVLGSEGSTTQSSIVLFNDGAGDFTRRTPYPLPPGPLGNNIVALDIKTIDVNGDGYPDLLIVGTQFNPNYVGGSIQLLVNQKNGTFADETIARLGSSAAMTTGFGWNTTQVVDINGDGKPDILASTEFGLPGTTGYTYLWINNGNGTFTPISANTLLPAPIGKLTAADIDGDGQLDLVAVQFVGNGNLKYQTYLNTSVRTAPGEPIIGTAVAGNAQVSVAFSAPLFTGASAITSYKASCAGGSSTNVAYASGATSPITVPVFVNFGRFSCTVTATNANGTSMPSAASNSVTPQGSLTIAVTGNATSNFGASVTLTATVNGASAPVGTIKFKANGATILGCTAQALVASAATCTTTALVYGANSITAVYSGDAGSAPAISPAFSHSVQGGYLSEFSGFNPIGTPVMGVGSSIDFDTTIKNVGNASVNLSGFSFTGPFTLKQNNCGPTLAPGSSCTVRITYAPMVTSGLITGSMQVTHTGGNSPFTLNITGTGTSLAPPSLVGVLNPASVIVGNARATLTLTMNNPNGVPLTNVDKYLALPGSVLSAANPNVTSNCGGIWISNGNGPSPASQSNLKFSGGTIPANGSCVISIDIVSTLGPGTYQLTLNNFFAAEITCPDASPVYLTITPPPTVPVAPTSVIATPGDGQATLAFTAPVNNGGSPITGYNASCNSGAVNVPAQVSPVILTGLTNGTFYSCFVTATNSLGVSPPSASVNVTPSATAPIFLVAVQSRKTHTGIGIFDLPIDTTQTGNGLVTVEPRGIGAGHAIVFQFNVVVGSFGAVSAMDVRSGISGSVPATQSGKEVIVTLQSIPDNRRIVITLNGVTGSIDSTDATASIGFLVGDINNTRSVNSSDISGVKARSGQTTTGANFKFDMNASGAVNSSDISAVKARSGLSLP